MAKQKCRRFPFMRTHQRRGRKSFGIRRDGTWQGSTYLYVYIMYTYVYIASVAYLQQYMHTIHIYTIYRYICVFECCASGRIHSMIFYVFAYVFAGR